MFQSNSWCIVTRNAYSVWTILRRLPTKKEHYSAARLVSWIFLLCLSGFVTIQLAIFANHSAFVHIVKNCKNIKLLLYVLLFVLFTGIQYVITRFAKNRIIETPDSFFLCILMYALHKTNVYTARLKTIFPLNSLT